MAAELPVITTKFNGLYPELVTNSNGWLIEIKNHDDSLATLIDVFNKRHNMNAMGKISLEIIKNYHPSKIASNFLMASE